MKNASTGLTIFSSTCDGHDEADLVLPGTDSAIYRSVAEAVAKLCDAEIAGISVYGRHGVRHHVLFGQADCENAAKYLSLCAATTLDVASHVPAGTATTAPVLLDLGDPFRFYAGVPLLDAKGGKLGAFFIAGRQPRCLTPQQSDTLCQLGRHVAALYQSEMPQEANPAMRMPGIGRIDDIGMDVLPDRARFERQLAQFMTSNNMQDQLFAVMSLHVDNFEDITCTLGEDVGSALLLQIAERLRNCLYANDFIGRGDSNHFLMVVQDLERAADLDVVIAKISAKCAQPFFVDGRNIFVTLSIGTALSALTSDLPCVLMRYADTAMHLAAKNGGNNHLLFRLEMRNHILEQTRIASDLTYALEAEQFELFYQAKVDLKTNLASGFEALLRWNHPSRGMISPADFIPVLEQTGLIVPVGEMVIRQACRQLCIWRAAGLALLPVAVNLSARQFESPQLLPAIEACLAEFDIPPALLELEITESALMRDVDGAARQLRKFSEMGLRIAVDDFGTGYSSLLYLKHFPLDALKIDRNFVHGIGVNHGDAEITRTVIQLAHSLGLKVIAEGVENITQLAFLEAHGCDQVQGFYFSRPAPGKQCEALLSADSHKKYHKEAACIAA
ncbi:GGDEF domain-containing protein [Oxalobacteraceae bacterium CAVE-383]|nr:GGDEF domain-containing protein [Oxalobacteraceae bacterium CAVE-383]